MSNDGAYEAERDAYGDNADAETEDMDADDAASEVKDTTSEVPAAGDDDGQEEKRSMVGDDDEDDDGYGDDPHDDEELEQGEVHEDDEGMDDDEEEEGEIHEDEDEMEGEDDAEMEHDEKHEEHEEVEHADEDAQDQAHAEEENKSELNYSTRGRTPTPETTAAAAVEMTDLGIREIFEELGKVREPLGSGASFLDSLTEEERRTRTRFLPDVEGFHQLRKHEVKSDLALARSLISAAPPAATRRARGKRNRGDDDAMEEEDEEGVEPSEDERGSDSAKVGTMVIDLRTTTITVPSNALVAPPPLQNGSNGESSESRDNSTVPSSRRWQNQIKSPLVVEAITAFNPPRPPESVGGKKKHRMLRWERRPTDIEDDLNIYRKTVQRTREELQSAERERERIEMVSAHLRRHYLGHLSSMNEEWSHLSLEMKLLRDECNKVVSSLSSKVKSPVKANHLMEEALLILKSLGSDLKGAPLSVTELKTPSSGVGGISSASFIDWGRTTTVSSTEIASSWILPGETVSTPYGQGTVLRVFGATPTTAEKPKPDENESGSGSAQANGSRAKNGSGIASLEPDGPKSGGAPSGGKDAAKLSKGSSTAKGKLGSVLPPRVCVRLAYGVGFFNVGCVSSRANPAVLSDAMLAQRWLKMAETAHLGGENLDIEGMAYINEIADKLLSDSDDVVNDLGKAAALKATDSEKSARTRLLPFGAGLLPTSNGHGGLLAEADITDIEAGMYGALYEAKGVLGKPSNEGVPARFKEWEDLRQEKYTLKAKALQLRNELLRQRRTRLMNDRTLAATKDRCLRIETLATEMKSDLNTLKERLDDELVELGIDHETAEDLLKQYFSELEETMLQEEANARHRMSSEDYAEGLDEEGSKARAHDGPDFWEEEESGRVAKKARVGQ